MRLTKILCENCFKVKIWHCKNIEYIDANPTFIASPFKYRDTSPKSLTVTNNNQLIVKNQLELGISFIDATVRKSAFISKHQITFN